MSGGTEVAAIALMAARELLLGYFRLVERAGLTPEEKKEHYEKIRGEFLGVNLDELRKPEEVI